MDNPPGPPSDPLIGQLIQGRYHVERVLSQGGMGQVYLAEQVSLKRPIALKVLRGMYDQDEQFIARFQREAEQAARLNHPHIVTIYDFGSLDGGGFFIAMEYVSGPTLGELLKNERLPVPRALQLGIQIAEGLQAAHHAGIIHRDVKPANIVVQTGDQIKLMDFGIARVQDSQTHLTHTGQPIGTPKYMAPEQWGIGPIGPQTDLYALGIVLYQMLSGQAPFSAPTPSLMRMHLDEPPPPLRPLLPDIPPSVEQIVLQALEKQPEQRQRDMGELIVQLQAALGGQDDENELTELLTPDAFVGQQIHGRSHVEQPLSKNDSSQAPPLAPVEPPMAAQPPPAPAPQPLPASPPPVQAAQTHKLRRFVTWLGIILGVGLAGFFGFQFFPIEKGPTSLSISAKPTPSADAQQQLQSHLQLGLFYIDREKYTEAIVELEKAQAIDPANAEVQTVLARAQRAGAPVLSASTGKSIPRPLLNWRKPRRLIQQMQRSRLSWLVRNAPERRFCQLSNNNSCRVIFS